MTYSVVWFKIGGICVMAGIVRPVITVGLTALMLWLSACGDGKISELSDIGGGE
jgi:hypothetical protein